MRTQDFIQVLEDLVAHNKLELAISVLRKFLKPIDKELYRQVIQLSASFVNTQHLGVSGTLSPEITARQRNYTVHALLFLLEQVSQQLPPVLTGESGDLARSLQEAIECSNPFTKQDIPQKSKASVKSSPASQSASLLSGMWAPVKQRAILALSFSGWFLFLLSLTFNFGQADPYDTVRKQQIFQLAHAYGLTEIDGLNAHLSFAEQDFDYWHQQTQQGTSLQEVEETFFFMNKVLQKAEKVKREILSRSDLELLADIDKEKK